MKREEAVALLKELSVEHLIQPTLVLIEKRTPDSYQLTVKADYDGHGVQLFVQKFNLAISEDKERGFLTIFTP